MAARFEAGEFLVPREDVARTDPLKIHPDHGRKADGGGIEPGVKPEQEVGAIVFEEGYRLRTVQGIFKPCGGDARALLVLGPTMPDDHHGLPPFLGRPDREVRRRASDLGAFVQILEDLEGPPPVAARQDLADEFLPLRAQVVEVDGRQMVVAFFRAIMRGQSHASRCGGLRGFRRATGRGPDRQHVSGRRALPGRLNGHLYSMGLKAN